MRLHIAVIDDDDAVRTSIVRMLRAHGHDATGAVDGEQALAAALVRRPDAIIVDIHMPGQNGLQVAQMFKAHSALAAVPILALSATPYAVVNTSVFRQVLAKPCTGDDLLIAIADAVQSHTTA